MSRINRTRLVSCGVLLGRYNLLFLLLLAFALPLSAGNLNIAEDRFCSQKLLQASLLGRQGFFGLLTVKLIDRTRHFFCGLSYIFYELGELWLSIELIAEPSPAQSSEAVMRDLTRA